MRLLIVTPYLPHRRVGHGGGTAVRQLIQALGRRHEVCVLSLQRPNEREITETGLGDGIRLETVPFRDQSTRGPDRLALVIDRAHAALIGWLSGRPAYAVKYDHAPLLRRARELVDTFDPDVVQVEYLQLEAVLRDLRRHRDAASRPRLILDSHEHGAVPRRRRAEVAGGLARRRLLAAARAWDRLAADGVAAADVTLAMNDAERHLLAAHSGGPVVTLPLGIDPALLSVARPADPPPQILFLGSFGHPPNREATRLLSRKIWPRIRAAHPDWQLAIAGPGSREFIAGEGLATAGLTACGFVDDLDALFARSAVFAAPLFSGGGIKIKILEAMARGIPLVTTPIGAEGIADENDDLVGWAEDPDTFIAVLLQTMADATAARERAARARQHIARHYSWDAIVTRLEAIYDGDPGSGS